MLRFTIWFLILIVQWQGVLGRAIPSDIIELDQRQYPNIPLRILPLGASITYGVHSSDGNGYRRRLKDQLRSEGWEVNMVGSQNSGNMRDNDVEARPGNTIDQVRTATSPSLPCRPNIVLINAGTNDCRLSIDIPNVGARMRSLIENILSAADMRDTLIVLSTLLPSGNADIARNTPAVNDQYRALVRTMRGQGTSIVLAEMSGLVYPEDFTQGGQVDDTHPGDGGYAKMARIWHDAILDAARQGLIPRRASLNGGLSCDRRRGDDL
ncbi:SGNH hydrolase-type esterase domain-containing protein [Aspergillus keveii]|uniref:SGNH hydrolase-type esterase domain-containing protein n=1 Tax=Aspergillus keveii TaxID=714993 RepID=A0ABR4GKW2_9EURO